MGIVSLNDLLKARVRSLEEEQHRERVTSVGRDFAFSSKETKREG